MVETRGPVAPVTTASKHKRTGHRDAAVEERVKALLQDHYRRSRRLEMRSSRKDQQRLGEKSNRRNRQQVHSRADSQRDQNQVIKDRQQEDQESDRTRSQMK